MKFVPITDKDYGNCYKRMESAFPYNERRDEKQWIKLFKYPEFHCYFLKEEFENKTVGFVTFWDYDEFVFIEHFAIDDNCRGKGYGTEFLKQFQEMVKKNIILEVEPPLSLQAIKRINFYNRAGLILNDEFYYEQPSYHNEDTVPLILMSSERLNEYAFNKFMERTRLNCYKDCVK